MRVGVADIRQQLRLGEDSLWEFKQVEFRNDRPVAPRRADLADEIAAFANAEGGVLLFGVTDAGQVQGMTRPQLDALERLVVEICADSIHPQIEADTYRHDLDGRMVLAVSVAAGYALHTSPGGSYRRVGSSKRRLTSDQALRLAQRRGQSSFLWFDERPVPDTGFATLSESLWKPLLSASAAAEPEQALRNLRLLTSDENDAVRATVAGVLLCANEPENRFPNAVVAATRYRGGDRASEQLDAQEISGPLQHQIADAVRFAIRNMRVAARKSPGRENLPQYSGEAVFEAVVNAVAHRDYSMHGRRIRLSMFEDRLEIDSPGALANGMTIAGMEASQATRNEVIASIFGRMPVAGIPGSESRQFLMERRGDGVPVILRATRETSGRYPVYRPVDDTNLNLLIPAADLEPSPARAVVTAHAAGRPLPGVDILALFPNRTWVRASSDETGEAVLDLHNTNLPMTVYAAAPGYAAYVEREWVPSEGALAVELASLPQGGSVVFPEATGALPGLRGRLNPILDTHDRTYLYASNIAIDGGRQQPVHFALGEELRLVDAQGVELAVRVVEILGRSALLEYRSVSAGGAA